MNIVFFRLCGRFGHFLRAEANASAPSYPVPPRTALIGLIGAVLGMRKDEPQTLLSEANIAISGCITQTHWHTAKFRKDPPAALPKKIKSGEGKKQKTKPEKATLITQEWLFNPNFRVWVNLPKPYHDNFAARIAKRRWHFQPCLGISEHLADLSFDSNLKAKKLPLDIHDISSVFPSSIGEVDIDAIFKRDLALHTVRMPQKVTEERVFKHTAYHVERDAKPVPIKTDKAVKVGNKKIVFL